MAMLPYIEKTEEVASYCSLFILSHPTPFNNPLVVRGQSLTTHQAKRREHGDIPIYLALYSGGGLADDFYRGQELTVTNPLAGSSQPFRLRGILFLSHAIHKYLELSSAAGAGMREESPNPLDDRSSPPTPTPLEFWCTPTRGRVFRMCGREAVVYLPLTTPVNSYSVEAKHDFKPPCRLELALLEVFSTNSLLAELKQKKKKKPNQLSRLKVDEAKQDSKRQFQPPWDPERPIGQLTRNQSSQIEQSIAKQSQPGPPAQCVTPGRGKILTLIGIDAGTRDKWTPVIGSTR
ncbi:hypothetical protein CEXT_693701 [Caerostris extrusa]|uniref:Uncharacterized protein n=1 Tax=Caerostris extrusa TaxID=172846 RepID=A0AAV4Y1E2_CAEEX|nr:hypothetical protein CEXT_693701 [Caerostris extrusa]